ncbi:MAG: DUF1801 domain-containing protein, partial [Myxococcaceae bacterium]|nr:DUF1801 domain-containing protein [Myxococcaceae bacterium]
RLRALVAVIRAEAPDAVERLSYGLATWHQGENLIHLGAFKHHVGIYPGAAAIVAFADALAGFKTSKGAIRVPHDAPLPLALVRRLTRWRVEQAAAKAARPVSKRRPRRSPTAPVSANIATYNASQSPSTRAVCTALAGHLSKALPEAASRLWHGHPVWFLERNPVVGYSAHREGTRLLFWSGQSFDEPALSPVGKFKAAEARYATVADVDAKALSRWLEKARAIQWDYGNIAKKKGQLTRLP